MTMNQNLQDLDDRYSLFELPGVPNSLFRISVTTPSTKMPPKPPSPTFHPFIRLPAELRIQIWEDSVESRLVYLIKPLWTKNPEECKPISLGYPPTPALLHACHESRQIGLELYKAHDSFDEDYLPKRYYFNARTDIFSIPNYGDKDDEMTWPYCLHPTPPALAPYPQHLLFQPKAYWALGARVASFALSFPHLKTIVVALNPNSRQFTSGMEGLLDNEEDLDPDDHEPFEIRKRKQPLRRVQNHARWFLEKVDGLYGGKVEVRLVWLVGRRRKRCWWDVPDLKLKRKG